MILSNKELYYLYHKLNLRVSSVDKILKDGFMTIKMDSSMGVFERKQPLTEDSRHRFTHDPDFVLERSIRDKLQPIILEMEGVESFPDIDEHFGISRSYEEDTNHDDTQEDMF